LILLISTQISQQPKSVLMVRPRSFGYNPETAASNAFQQLANGNASDIAQKAIMEFDRAVDKLRKAGVEVIVVDDSEQPQKSDAVFPNNWISTHEDGSLVLYPMLSANRRLERRREIIEALDEAGYDIRHVLSFTNYEQQHLYLEGTGSIIFDYVNKTAYANRSPRTNEQIFREVCQELGYEAIIFDAYDKQGREIYHTNVMMCIGERFVILCAEAIPLPDRKEVYRKLEEGGFEIIKINYDQMEAFAGNMMELRSKTGQSILAMSFAAFNSLETDQMKQIQQYAKVVHIDIPTIEKYGGGSLRCMLAGVFLPRK
jgi:hypothetical protein